jgi:hypothetical protein
MVYGRGMLPWMAASRAAMTNLPGIAGEAILSAATYFIVGMTNSAPSLTPLGQRDVTVLVLV